MRTRSKISLYFDPNMLHLFFLYLKKDVHIGGERAKIFAILEMDFQNLHK